MEKRIKTYEGFMDWFKKPSVEAEPQPQQEERNDPQNYRKHSPDEPFVQQGQEEP